MFNSTKLLSRKLSVALATLISCSAWICVSELHAGENYAFLVAVGDYDVKHLKPLKYTRNDILAFRGLLLESGFRKENIVLLHDDLKQLENRRYLPEAEKIRREFTLLLSGVQKDDTLIVAMAGHGVQFKGDKSSYFCPADADLDDEEHKRLIAFDELYSALEKCEARKKLLLVDACRNDPQSQLSRSRARVDLESITRPQSEPLPEGIVALFSCSAGEQAFEWPDLEHGVFFHHVLEAWKGAADDGDMELSLDELVAYTRKKTQTFVRLKLASIQRPQRLGEFSGTWTIREFKKEFKVNGIGMKLMRIPAGEFLMGSGKTVDELVRTFGKTRELSFEKELPQHKVQITKPFYLQATEVTQGQWKAVMQTEPWNVHGPKSEFNKGKYKVGDGYPAIYVSWEDAQEFCKKLSRKEGVTYRLPTEAEWEYACRAGTTTMYSFGDDHDQLGDFAWINPNTFPNELYPHRVGLKLPNPWGLYDMYGNVREWCKDSSDREKNYYLNSPSIDPQGPGSGPTRVLRGGAYFFSHSNARSAYRVFWTPGYINHGTGFRVVAE